MLKPLNDRVVLKMTEAEEKDSKRNNTIKWKQGKATNCRSSRSRTRRRSRRKRNKNGRKKRR